MRGRANGTVSAYAWCRLGDITTDQFRGLAQIAARVRLRDPHHQPPELRAARSHRGPAPRPARPSRRARAWRRQAPSSPATSCRARAPTPATSRSRSRAASPPTSATRSRRPASPRWAACASTSPAAPTRAASTTSPTSASSASSAAPTAAPRPATRWSSAVTSATWTIAFGKKATKLPAKRASEAVVRVVEQFAGERDAGETFSSWLERGRRRGRGGQDARRSRRVPHPRGSARLLHRLRRDRALRGRGRRLGVRDVTADRRRRSGQSEVPDLADLARVSAELEQEPASSAIKWAWETFGTGAVLAASFQDCVLIDIATQVVPEIEVVFLDTQYHFAETLWYVEQVRERYDLNLRVISPQIDARQPLADRPRRVLRDAQGRAAGACTRRQVGVAHRPAPRRSADARERADRRVRRRPRHREGQPDRATGPTTRSRATSPTVGCRVHPLRDKGYPSIGCWPCTNPVEGRRRPARRPLDQQRQARVRAPRLDAVGRPPEAR